MQGDTLTMELTGIGDAETLARLMAPLQFYLGEQRPGQRRWADTELAGF